MESINRYIKNILSRCIYGKRSTPELFIQFLKEQGIQVGEGTIFFDPINTIVDTQNPKLLKFGCNVRVTSGTVILTHDFSWSVVAGVYGECLGAVGSVEIGDNVFIGVNTVILRNTKIGNNIIVGAGSVVSGILEDNSVYAGNPVKKIMTLDEFYHNRLIKKKSDIRNIMSNIDITNEDEVWKYMREYCCSFADAPSEMQKQIMIDSGYEDKCVEFYANNVTQYRVKDFV